MIKILFFLVALCAQPVWLFAQTDTRATATWQVQKYDIAAVVPSSDSDRQLIVKAKLDVKNISSRPAATLTLRISPAAEVSAVAVNGSTVEFTKGEEKVGTGSLQRIAVRLSSIAPAATVSVTVDYKLSVKDNSGLASISSVGTQFLPLSFWYPTPNSWFFSRGADNAPLSIKVTAPSGMNVIAAGTESAGSFTTGYRSQPFFTAGAWEVVQAPAGASVYIPHGASSDAKARANDVATVFADATAFISAILGPKPAEPARLVAVRKGAGFSSGTTILFDEAVLHRPKLDSLSVMNMAEAVAKSWLGGSVSIDGDGGGAVREGLARFLATEFLESKYGKEVADVERQRQRSAYSAVVEREVAIAAVSPLDDSYFSVVANKGAMVWRQLHRKAGPQAFNTKIASAMQDKDVSLAEIRAAFSDQKEFLDYSFDQATDLNLLAGLPQAAGGETKVALRNTGSVDATVDVDALLENGQRMTASTTVRARSFGEVAFRAATRVRRVEVDREKLFPQTDFSDDVAPREFTESDALVAVKRLFDRQEFADAERLARTALIDLPRFDDVRILLARSLLGQNKLADAEREFKAILDEPLPSARSIGWAYVGLADIAQRQGQNERAAAFATSAIRAEAEYGAALLARSVRGKAGGRSAGDASISAFFEQWDKAALANQKAQLDSMVMPGEASRFSSGVAGQTAQWKTQVVHVDMIDANTALVETSLSIKLLNREPESGTAVFRLTRSGGSWKILSVDSFEVR